MYFGFAYLTDYGWQNVDSIRVKMSRRGAGIGLRNLPEGTYMVQATFSEGRRHHMPSSTKPTYFKIT